MITDLKSADILLISDNFLLEQKEINEVLSKEALMGEVLMISLKDDSFASVLMLLVPAFGTLIFFVLLALANKFKKDVPIVVLVIISLVLGFFCVKGLFALFDAPFSSSSSSGGSSNTNVCKVCGNSYEAGDSGGNYMNIAKTGMCNNCYNNYQWGQKAIGN